MPVSRGAIGCGVAVLLLAFQSQGARADGYWACSGGSWTEMGHPTHPMPEKPCGFTLDRPKNAEDCAVRGGTWAPAGLSPKPLCRMPTGDGGRVCGDNDECEGMCLATLTPKQRDDLRTWSGGGRKLRLSGRCTPSTPVFGCMAIVSKGFVRGLMCLD